MDQDRSIAAQRAISRTVRLSRKLHHGGISRQTLRSVVAAAEVLQFVPTTPDRSELQGFATAFAERYGHAGVPLLKVLDPFYGLGFGPRAATLTEDQQGPLTWNWGSLRYLSYLPRVRFGNCILALQTWRIQHRDRAMSKSLTERQLLDWGRDLLDAHRTPQCFTYRSANEDKVVDARNAVSLMMFAREAREAPGDIVIKELFPAPGDSPVQDESGAQYQHDIIVPYVRRHSMRRRPRIAGLPQPEVQREFPPGSELDL